VTPRIRLSDLTVARGGATVAEGVSLDVAAGEVTALVGPSGSGKSSVLRAIVRLDEPAGGVVEVDGADARTLDPRELRRRVGLVFQRPVMLAGTVRDNVAYGVSGPVDAAAALADAGLDPAFLDRDAATLSGGEMARVAVARALTRDPAALLLDEPTAALDHQASEGIEQLVRSLAGRSLAVVVVTHDEASAARMADRAARLEAGRLVAAGPAAEVLRP
jgi:ABC-type multidrug transport system fused ATPase/permease subunit